MRSRIIGSLAFGSITAILVALAVDPVRAQNCPGNPDALGTSSVLAIDPREYPRVGAMDHAAALPLADKEVVLTFDDGPLPRYSNQILDILAAQCVKAGDPTGVAPFFRVPGLAHSDLIDSELAARSLVVFSCDTVADDWHPRISPKKIITLALKRLEARGKGILLLHDIHRATVAALPELLKELKEQGFHVVQVVPAPVRQF
jgi:peptidoglycan/xylan/chitin deacetylase (PgdA/CDA1 family)